MSSRNKLAIFYLILANVIWGAALPIYKWTLEVIPPFTFAFLRFFIASVIIFVFVKGKLKIKIKDIPLFFLGSLVTVSLQIPLLFFGLKLAPSINAPIIIASGPIIMIAASIIFLKERVSKKLLLGTLISLIGVLILILKPAALTGNFGDGSLGNFLIFIATVCGVIQAFVFKKLLKNYEPFTMLFVVFLMGSLSLIPEVYIEYQNTGLFNFNFHSISGIIFAVFFATVIAHYFLTYGIKHINVSEIGIFSYVDPIATIIIAIPLLGEKITPTYVFASILVFAGIFIAEGRLHYHPLHRLLK